MEPFLVSARKYRPQTFEDVVGQQSITQTLENAIAQNHLAQALLFCGPRGVGKTTCARILAKRINEADSDHPSEDFAFNIFELDAASNNSVDDIRNLIDQVRIPPQQGKFKVYIIDEVHMLSSSAFNAFLKTLEEPPKHAVFILATTEKHKIIPTILSRCQIFDFKRITVTDTVNYLKYIAKQQEINADEDALHLIALKADGAMRDALSIFDRMVSFAGVTMTKEMVAEHLNVLDYATYLKITELLWKGAIPEVLLELDQVLAKGFDAQYFIAGLAAHFRDLMMALYSQTGVLLEMSDHAKAKMMEQAALSDADVLRTAIDVAQQCDFQYKAANNKRLSVELCLMKIASLHQGEKKNDLDERIGILPAALFKNRLPTSEKPMLNMESTPDRIDPQPEIIMASSDGQIQEVKDTQDVISSEVAVPLTIKKDWPIGDVSAFSLSSIKSQKERKAAQKSELASKKEGPQDAFSQELLINYWREYAEHLAQIGQKILSSSLYSDDPILIDGQLIQIELPNDTMKKEVERSSGPLLDFLKEKLNHYGIQLRVEVKEALMEKYAYTPEEKYEKLRAKNPHLDFFKSTLDLELN
ncbi:MAG TPA: DNA polymerase III subunit gamma/tau [Flavobacteriaceae bacterium]|jgi:DNA polymerase-3 subunit gamma/tau|nr:DNA polymerase III subunit gamma/tau [Flavobacteriaceae bacterium]